MGVRFQYFFVVVNINNLMINIHIKSRHRELFDLLGARQGQSLVMTVQLYSMQVTRFVKYQ